MMIIMSRDLTGSELACPHVQAARTQVTLPPRLDLEEGTAPIYLNQTQAKHNQADHKLTRICRPKSATEKKRWTIHGIGFLTALLNITKVSFPNLLIFYIFHNILLFSVDIK